MSISISGPTWVIEADDNRPLHHKYHEVFCLCDSIPCDGQYQVGGKAQLAGDPHYVNSGHPEVTSSDLQTHLCLCLGVQFTNIFSIRLQMQWKCIILLKSISYKFWHMQLQRYILFMQ